MIDGSWFFKTFLASHQNCDRYGVREGSLEGAKIGFPEGNNESEGLLEGMLDGRTIAILVGTIELEGIPRVSLSERHTTV